MGKKLSFSLLAVLILIIVLSGCGKPSPVSFSIPESLVPASSSTQFPTGVSDSDGNCTAVNYPFYIAKNEVTYKLWKEVYDWALSHGYTFANTGSRGGYWTVDTEDIWASGHETDPVTTINWRDAIVWCNALTEYYNAKNKTNLTCAYKDGNNIIRDSLNDTAICDNLTDDGRCATGFRLPTSMEWELAARYKGSDSSNGAIECPTGSGKYWTPGGCASGATAEYSNAPATKEVAWYFDNSNYPDADIHSTQPVGQKNANALGIYDMSGNVREWCFDWHPQHVGSCRVCRGGVYYDDAYFLTIGLMNFDNPDRTGDFLGFRPVRSQNSATRVVVQLTKIDGGANYPVGLITVAIQKTNGPALIGVTGADGIVKIPVTETGIYQVIKVEGVDASELAQGNNNGREFVKASPLTEPYPNLTYTFTTIPTANVTALGSDYPVNAPVPSILKVTVLKVGSVTATPAVDIAAGTASFTGRVMLSNINCSDNRAGIAIQSNDVNNNRLIIYSNISGGNPQISSASFYSVTGVDVGTLSNYTQAGPIYFEAPGTDSGDWASGCNLSATNLKTRSGLGGADATRNFPGFKNNAVIHVFSTAGGSPTYQFDYRIFKFETM